MFRCQLSQVIHHPDCPYVLKLYHSCSYGGTEFSVTTKLSAEREPPPIVDVQLVAGILSVVCRDFIFV